MDAGAVRKQHRFATVIPHCIIEHTILYLELTVILFSPLVDWPVIVEVGGASFSEFLGGTRL